MLLNGFGFSGYRSFGNDLAKIAPLRKINLIIGQNNVGKSNIINFLSRQYSFSTSCAQGNRQFLQKINNPFSASLDRHISNQQIDTKIAFPLLRSDINKYINKILQGKSQHPDTVRLVEKVLTHGLLCDEECIWFVYKTNSFAGNFELDIDIDNIAVILEKREWRNLWEILTNQHGGDLKPHWIPETMNKLAYVPLSIPEVEVISAIRKIGQAGSEIKDFSGEGIIERLAAVQNPSLDNWKDKQKFDAINNFVRRVLDNSSAKIEIPNNRSMIIVEMDEKPLPLESLGTGVHEVVLLAAASTILENTIICVEEPELHLHPLLQKKLIKYLSEETNNQYLFTTHSAHLLDAVEAEIFHVTQINGSSHVEAVYSTKQKSNICNDLGYKASDLLQANCIVWVEGPSDRIYLNYWLKDKRPDLVEGIHYSIMFYGGRLFSHLTALDDDEEDRVEDFISVRKLNRNTVIMFDSDKDRPRAKISPTKKRLKDEFNKGPGFTWVTKGREVENYLNMDNVEKAVLAVHSKSADRLISKNKWSNLLKYKKKRSSKEETASKVKVAQYYTANYPVDFSILDLDNMVDKLINFILASNGYEV
jgi:predicted ATP-dependent endonuclease of OLD family